MTGTLCQIRQPLHYVVGLGSNLGSREQLLQAALAAIASEPDCRIVALSWLYQSAPVGPPQPDYLNAAARIESELDPHALLALLLRIEAQLGRVRHGRWQPRTIDLDLLWAELEVRSEQLCVPHPHLTERWFALAPLLDVAPELADRYGPALAGLAISGRRLHPLVIPRGLAG